MFKKAEEIVHSSRICIWICTKNIHVSLILLDTLIIDIKYKNMMFLKSLMVYLAEVQG